MPRPIRTAALAIQQGPVVEQHRFSPNLSKWIHRVRQSDIKRFEQCPEQHRRHLLGLESQMDNDSAVLGTTFALFPEGVLRGLDPLTALQQAIEVLTEAWHKPSLNQVTFESLTHAVHLLTEAAQVWLDEVMPSIPQYSQPEVRFSVQAHEDAHRIILLEGTSDLWCPDGSIWDWKYSGRSYIGEQAWKLERYDPQPPHYVLARSLTENAAALNRRFKYCNLNRDDRKKRALPVKEELPLRLSVEDLDFHLHRVYNMCTSIERWGFQQEWILGPTDWWCSPVWCPSWNDCRGSHIGSDPWNTLQKRLKG